MAVFGGGIPRLYALEFIKDLCQSFFQSIDLILVDSVPGLELVYLPSDINYLIRFYSATVKEVKTFASKTHISGLSVAVELI